MAYGQPDRIRRLYTALTTDVVSDAAINLVAADVDVEIDAELGGYGAPFSPTPALIGRVGDLKTCAQLFDNYFSQTADESRVASSLRKQAQTIIAAIKSGAMSCSGVTLPGMIATSDPEDDRPATEVFTGSELQWSERLEERE